MELKLTVLQIEADPVTAQRLQQQLPEDTSVVQVTSVAAAREAISQGVRPAALLLCINSEEPDDFPTVRQCRQFTDAPIILIAEIAHSNAPALAIKAGADDYLTLDSDPVLMHRTLHHALLRHQRDDDLRLAATVFSHAHEGVAIANANGELLDVNEAFCQMTGYPRAEIIGRNPRFLKSGCHDQDFYRNLWQQLLTTGHWSGEMWNKRKDGELILEQLTISSVRNACGQINNFVCLRSDVTQRKQMEEALKESEATVRTKLRAILEPEGDIEVLNLADMIDIPALQEMMEDFYQINGMGCAITDLAGKVLIAVGWQDICTDYHRIHPETRRNCEESNTVLASGVAPGQFKAYHCKNNMWDMVTPINVGGKHIGNIFLGQFFYQDEELNIALFREQARRCGFPEADYMAALDRVPRWKRETVDAAMVFYSKLAAMISSLGYSQIALSRLLAQKDIALRQLRNVVQATRAGTWEWNIPGDSLQCNDRWADIVGYQLRELVPVTGIIWQQLIHPEDLTMFNNELSCQVAGEAEVFKCDLRLRHKTGKWVWVVICGQLINRDSAGNPLLMAGTIVDISARKKEQYLLEHQKKQLEQRNRALRQFNYAVSHELKTPLVSIESSLGLIQGTLPQTTDPELTTAFGYARHATRQMNNLLESLLLMFRIDAADTDTETTACGVLVQDAIDQLTGGDKLKGIKVTNNAEGPEVSGDRHKLVQIWLQLVDNAAKYMGDQKDPAIDIGFEQTVHEVLFFVRDNGMGIEQPYQGKIFGLFDRLDKNPDGTGLGLTLVQRIVDYYGGSIWVKSEGLGKGSCFYFTLPDILIKGTQHNTASAQESAAASEELSGQAAQLREMLMRFS